MREKQKRAWEIPLLITLFAVLIGLVFGIRGACSACKESTEKSLRKMAASQASADYKCRKVRVLSGDQDTGVYAVDVCGTKRWYRCRVYPRGPFSRAPRCERMKSVQ